MPNRRLLAISGLAIYAGTLAVIGIIVAAPLPSRSHQRVRYKSLATGALVSRQKWSCPNPVTACQMSIESNRDPARAKRPMQLALRGSSAWSLTKRGIRWPRREMRNRWTISMTSSSAGTPPLGLTPEHSC